jgi:hypothetical protein
LVATPTHRRDACQILGPAVAWVTDPNPADVGLGSVCPLIIEPHKYEAGIGYLSS